MISVHLAVSGKSQPRGNPKEVKFFWRFSPRRVSRWERVISRAWQRIQGDKVIGAPTRVYVYLYDERATDEYLAALADATARGVSDFVNVQDVRWSRFPSRSKRVLVVLNAI